MRLFLLLFLSIVIPTAAIAEIHSYDHYSTIYLGAGFDPEKPDEAFTQCIDYEDIKNVDTNGSIKTTFDASIVRSREDLHKHLGISASASARYKFFSGSAAMSFTDDFSFHSDSIVWIVKGQSFYGRYQMINPKLNDAAQSLIDDNNFSAFARKCGTKFISQENRSVLIAAVFSIENVSNEHKQKLTTEFKVAVSGGLFDGSATGSYKKFFSEATKRSQIKMSVYAIGGSGITKLHGLMTQSDDLNTVQGILAEYVLTLNSSNAAPLSYVSGSMEVFGWKGSHNPQVNHRDRTLSQIYFRYKESETTINRLNDVIVSLDTPLWSFIPAKQYDMYLKQRDEHETYLTLLSTAADNCYYDSKCVIPLANLSRVEWPIEMADKCELRRIAAFINGKINHDTLTALRKFNMVPLFSIPDDPTSEHVGLAECSYIL